MKPFIFNLNGWLDSRLKSLGYMKASDMPVTMLHSGETRPGEIETSRYSNFSDEQMERLAITSAWVYSDISIIGNQVSQGLFGVYEKGSNDKIDSHPLEDILENQPNEHMSQSFIWKYTAMWLLLRGEAYWWLVADSSGELREVWPIPASHMQPIPDKENYIRFYAYAPVTGENPIPISAEQVCYFRLPNPFEYRRGLSPISAFRLTLEGDIAAIKFSRDTFEKGLSLRALISLREGMNKRDFMIAKQDIIDSQREGDRYLISRAGDTDVKALSITQKDAEFLANRQFSRDEIDRVYGFPAGFWSEQSNRANSEQAFTTLMNLTIWPMMNMLAEDVTNQVLRRYYDVNLIGKFDDIRAKNRELDLKEKQAGRQIMTWNEAREADGLEPVENGDIPFIALKELAASRLQTDNITDDSLAKADLRRWKSVARREAKRGKNPADYDFQSQHIPVYTSRAIKAGLEGATEDRVPAVFEEYLRDSNLRPDVGVGDISSIISSVLSDLNGH